MARGRTPPSVAAALRFVSDEDGPPEAAKAGRGLGLDIVSIHEVGRRELPDDEQLRWAAAEGRIMVTRNRDDYIEWTAIFFQRGAPHAGVIIVTPALWSQRPERLAHTLRRWHDRMTRQLAGHPLSQYFIDFLTG